MAKIKVFKHVSNVIRDIDGHIIRKEYYYTVAVKRFSLWFHLKFYGLHTDEVLFEMNLSKRYATHFTEEGDALYRANDIIQNPQKYYTC